MKEQLSALYELQRLDVRIGQIKARLAAMQGAKDLEKRIEQAKASDESAEKSLQEREAELRDSELKLKSIDEKRGGFEKRLYGGSVSNPKELGAIEKEIAMLKSRQGQLDGLTLELYDQVEAARQEAQAARKLITDLENALKTALDKEVAEKVSLEAEMAELTSQREASAPRVTDKSLIARYETVRKKTGNTGIAKVIGGKCEGCRISIVQFTSRKLFEDKEYVCCESCGLIHYLDPNA